MGSKKRPCPSAAPDPARILPCVEQDGGTLRPPAAGRAQPQRSGRQADRQTDRQTDTRLSGPPGKPTADGKGGLLAEPRGSGDVIRINVLAFGFTALCGVGALSEGMLVLGDVWFSSGLERFSACLAEGLLRGADVARCCLSGRRFSLLTQTCLMFPGYFYFQGFSSKLVFFYPLLFSLIKTFWIIPRKAKCFLQLCTTSIHI